MKLPENSLFHNNRRLYPDLNASPLSSVGRQGSHSRSETTSLSSLMAFHSTLRCDGLSSQLLSNRFLYLIISLLDFNINNNNNQ